MSTWTPDYTLKFDTLKFDIDAAKYKDDIDMTNSLVLKTKIEASKESFKSPFRFII